MRRGIDRFVVTAMLLLSACGPAGSGGSGNAARSSVLDGTPPVAGTPYGDVEGSSEGDLAVFRGVPFAAPPVGDLRWKPPVPPEAWDGVRPATEFGPSCYQGGVGLGADGDRSSEDCLYLNVWTPARSTADALPVMVWFPGGGFATGSTATALYGGEQLADRGVIVVSVAYRLGPFGFLAHPGLTAESPEHVSGNYGLQDQIAALEWVQASIRGFGGDPDNVTIFGESAGGIAVSILAASPLASGLFRRAVSESGGSFGATHSPPLPGENVQRLDQAEREGERFAETLGASSLAAMRAAAASEVLAAAGRTEGVSWPVMDGYVIPDDQVRLYEAGRYNDVPVLIGFNSDEGALFERGPVTTADYESSVRGRYGPFADEILGAFPPESDSTATQAMRDLSTDVMFGWHTLVWAELQSRAGSSPVYLYYFDQKPPSAPGSPFASAKGAPHASELVYVFDHLDQRPGTAWRSEDRVISAAMADYWTNFAKTGDPNRTGLPAWPPFSEAEPLAMIFRGQPRAGPLPDPEHFDVLDRYFAWRRSPEGAQP